MNSVILACIYLLLLAAFVVAVVIALNYFFEYAEGRLRGGYPMFPRARKLFSGKAAYRRGQKTAQRKIAEGGHRK